MAMQATYDRQQGHEVHWNDNDGGVYDEVVTKPGRTDFLSLPIPDRIFTLAYSKRYQLYGNYKYNPATHMMVADGCWWGKCEFCVEKNNTWKVRNIQDCIMEVRLCWEQGFREIFDDSGTFPTGTWLERFCQDKTKFIPDMVMGCNMRIDGNVDWAMMKRANFRMVLFGIESANQHTLNHINKGIKKENIMKVLREASKHGLEPHISCMVGYPWETDVECLNTIDFIKKLLIRGYARTAQVSFYAPGGDIGVANINQHKFASSIFYVALSPSFWYHQIRCLKSFSDFKYLMKGIHKGLEALWVGRRRIG